ncbi:hypothetical protein Peternella1_59 [Winogradskyella phage Peternella_1]|uniref:Uncharacterized protein n=1 Tax=Winogradskyella phage Peternella_1 TaxID=2745699 RepID=A0A8E4ZMZ6_9CAUD|nr:hypothetical protein M1M32_gp59 [Winogradskyella phage Peternella_1]QQV91595.1 hypothetical protein Peternella1_59 [Winogradskyella phage Peternella_1]
MSNFLNVDIEKLVQLCLPIDLRKPKTLAFINALITPLKTQYIRFTKFKESVFYIVSHNSSIVLLQKMLNDKFDNEERRIYISNIQRTDINRFYYWNENKEFGLYNEGNVQKGFYYAFENEAQSPDYVVHIPIEYQPSTELELQKYEVKVKSEINRYNHYSKTYIIEWIN